MKALFNCSIFFAAIALVASAAQAQQDLPTGQKVVDRFVEATGGKEKYEAVQTMTAKGTFLIQQAGREGTLEIHYEKPDKIRINLEIPGLGKIEKGNLGDVAWEMSAVTGNRLLQGEEARRFREIASMKTTYDPSSVYESIENTGIEQVDGEPCYKVTMKRKGSDVEDATYYSVETGLAIKSVTHEATPAGPVTAHTTFSDYKEIDGIKTPMRQVQELAGLGMTQEIKIESLRYNEPIEESVFELPEPVRQLVQDSTEGP